LKLDGYADSATELLPTLDESPFFREVAFLSTITKGKDGKERFRIGGKIESSANGGEAP
jgi:general secretion pathway protein L